MTKLFSKKNKGLLWLLIILAVGFGALAYFNQQFALVSVSNVRLEGDKYVWLSTFVVNKGDDTITHTYKGEEKQLSDGKKIIPQDSISLTVNNIKSYCDYQLNELTIGSLFFKKTYYEPVRVGNRFLYDVTSSKGGSYTVDGMKNDVYRFSDPDQKGVLRWESVGTSALDCPEGTNVAIYIKDGIINYYDKTDFKKKFGFFLTSPTIKVNQASGFKEIFVDTNLDVVNKKLTAKIENFKFGTVSLATVVADQDYFDSVIYSPPRQGTPRVEEIGVSNIVTEATQSTVAVTVKNIASNPGNFNLEVFINNGAISPPNSVSYEIPANSMKTSNFVLRTATVLKDTTTIITAKVCDKSSFGEDKCDTKTQTFVTKNQEGIFPPKQVCGDNNCDITIGETYLTCSNDCKEKLSCDDIPNTYLEPKTRTCQCLPDFEKDDKGVCVPSTTNFLPFLIIGLAILVAIVVILFSQKRK